MSDVRAGVVGVGTMGQNHARIYAELGDVDLVGVADADAEQAQEVADAADTDVYEIDELLDRVDVVSVAVPTQYHYETVLRCVEAGVDTLVEKPLVDDVEAGRKLARRAEAAGVTLQVGHVERFNPAVRTLDDVVDDLDVVAVDVQRLGPPVDPDRRASVVTDLMIHDIDVLLSLVDADVRSVSAVGTRENQHVVATLQFEDGLVANLTASRLTQRKVRRLNITAADRLVEVDYLDQSVDIYRRSLPAYVRADGDVRYRHESVVERPIVDSGEPLKIELQSFVEAATTDAAPVVGPTAGIDALALAQEIDRLAADEGDRT